VVIGLPDDRQKRTGWVLVAVSAGYLVYFVKVRLLEAGLPIERKEWFYFVAMIVCLMLGTANIRLATMRLEKRKSSEAAKKITSSPSA
jgi:Na+/melibiose symporter-like transporter